METVEVVIRIPKQVYEHVNVWKDLVYDDYIAMVGNAILNCTVLPKGHGRLIDADIVTKDINAFHDAFAMYTDNMGKYNIVCAAPTVIEADKEEKA